MATFSRVSPEGWQQGDDSATFSRVSPDGWEQFTYAGAPPAPTVGTSAAALPGGVSQMGGGASRAGMPAGLSYLG